MFRTESSATLSLLVLRDLPEKSPREWVLRKSKRERPSSPLSSTSTSTISCPPGNSTVSVFSGTVIVLFQAVLTKIDLKGKNISESLKILVFDKKWNIKYYQRF